MSDKGNQLLKTVFGLDNPVMRVAEKMIDLVGLNLLFLLSCLPLVTIGIAKMSLYQVLFQMRKTRRIRLFKLYIEAFRENLKQGFQLGVIELLVSALCIVDLVLFSQQDSLPFQVIKVLSIGILIFTTLLYLAIYPLAGRYQLSLEQIFKNSMIIVSLNFPWFFLMVGVLAVVVVVLYTSPLTLLLGLTALILFGISGLAWLQVGLLERIFDK